MDGRYYHEQAFQFSPGTPDGDLGAIVADVTGLPDTSKVKIIARIREQKFPGGFHNTYVYRHSDGQTYLVVTVVGPVPQRIRQLEWPRLGSAKHLECAGLRSRPGGCSGNVTANQTCRVIRVLSATPGLVGNRPGR